jgi:hypothetical protein
MSSMKYTIVTRDGTVVGEVAGTPGARGDELLGAILDQIIPDPISEWGMADEETAIVGTTTGRMFVVMATDGGAFEVREIDADRFR